MGISFGKITVVGTGPGDIRDLTPRALEAIKSAAVVIGYKTYLREIEGILAEGQEKLPFGMKDEIRRCETAIEKSMEGKTVALVSGGDAGIYGMSGLLLEIMGSRSLLGKIPLEIVPGMPAFCSAAAALGAPIMNDFCVISLSNLLTPWDEIEKRLRAASSADFVIILYNPSSRRRRREFVLAKNILLEKIEGERPVAVVKAASRPDEAVEITILEKMDLSGIVSMNSAVIIGNSSTYVKDLYMITRRGYGNKYNLEAGE